MKKLSFLLAIILLLSLPLMAACSKGDNSEQSNPQVTTDESTTSTGTTAPEEEEDPIVHASILVEQLADYEMVLAKSASAEVVQTLESLRRKMQADFEVPINKKTANAYNKTQYEILIGDTNREETAAFFAKYDMTWKDYGYGIVGDKLVIAGKNEDGTLEALRAFFNYVNKYNGGDVFFSNADLYLVTDASYPYKNPAINGIPVSELSILCNQQELGGIAYIIRDAIIEACGIAVPIITDADVKAEDKLMIIGESTHVPQELLTAWSNATVSGNDYYFLTDRSACCWLNAKTAAGYYNGAAEFAKLFSKTDGDGKFTLIGEQNGEDAIPVMSFNLKAESAQSDYNARLDALVSTILKYRPMVVGVQEATDMWIGLLQQRLGDTYTIVGDGRNADRGDEHSAILYLTEEFECLQSGTKWLSETPDVPGSQHSMAISTYPRIMTYVVLERKSDGKQFLHVNTHLDYGTTDLQEQVKVAQMQVIFDEIAKLNLSDIPTIITGDFNATVDSPVYNMVIDAGYQDSCYGADIQSPTYHALMGTTGEPSHIDFIFHKNMEGSSHFRICSERVDNENVSDHYPILTVLTFLAEQK